MVFTGKVQSDFLKLIPAELDNKQKLIDYSASDFESLRKNLIKYVQATFPLDYNNFEASDFGVLLLELMAAVGHIQSNKSDYLANENYLGTARNRDSVKRLLELVGVRMKGPISAAANASLTFVNNRGVPINEISIQANNRVITVTSPEDGATLTYTLYKVNTNGTIDLTDTTNDLVFTLDPPVDPSDQAVINNAVLLEGALVVEEGVFDSAETIKTVNLSEFPYVEKSAQVYIEGSTRTEGVYLEEDNIYFASGSEDQIFQVATDDSFKASIMFGDDSVGKSPAIGDRYTITYRVGGGTRGNLDRGALNAQTRSNTSEVITVENTSKATGGRDSESISQARRYAPLYFRSQDRLVTLADYKAFCNLFASNYGSTGKATATVRRAYSSANIIDLFVLERASDLQLRKATQEYKKQLLEAIDPKKMITDEVVVVDGLIRTLDLIITITLDEKYRRNEANILANARDSILNYMNMDNTDFQEPFVPQDLIRVLLEDETNIRYAQVDNVESPIRVGFNEIIQLNNLTLRTEYV